jgi:hypothetical protein
VAVYFRLFRIYLRGLAGSLVIVRLCDKIAVAELGANKAAFQNVRIFRTDIGSKQCLRFNLACLDAPGAQRFAALAAPITFVSTVLFDNDA